MSQLTVYGLLANEVERPLNVEGELRLTWCLKSEVSGAIQSAYRIEISDAVTGVSVWDSGRVESSSQFVVVPVDGFEPGRPYVWTVRAWDGDGAQSAPAVGEFACGLAGTWKASWTQSQEALDTVAAWVPSDGSRGPEGYEPGGSDIGNVYWYERGGAALEPGKQVLHAIAFVAGSQDYELSVNGVRQGRGNSFDYATETRYQAWDITSALEGADVLVLGALVRWYGGGQGRAQDTVPAFIAQAVIWYEDGSRQDVASDGTWVCAPGPFGGNVLRNGEGDFVEECDGRRFIPAWSDSAFDASGCEPVVVLGGAGAGAQTAPFSCGVQPEYGHVGGPTVGPKTVTELEDGSVLVDFGAVMTGHFSIDFPAGQAGRRITLHTGYDLGADGHLFTEPETGQNQRTDLRFIYTFADGAQTYRSWDIHGFRYIELPPLDMAFSRKSFRVHVVAPELPHGREASFDSSDKMLNRVFSLMQRSSVGSTTCQFLDTPTRERGQFLGDGYNIGRATMAGWGERATSRKAILQFLASSDRWWSTGDGVGRYNSVYPNVDHGRDIPDYSLMMPLWVRYYYEQTGDRTLLSTAWRYMQQTADYIMGSTVAEGPLAGLVADLLGGGTSPTAPYYHGIIDWPEHGRFGYDMACSARTVINAWAYAALEAVAFMARELGEDKAAAQRGTQADALAAAMREKLVDGAGVFVDGLMADGKPSLHKGEHASTFPLAFGIADPATTERLVAHIASMGMRQGPMTADVLVQALFRGDAAPAAVRVLTNTNDLGWADLLVNRGGTFTWEQWVEGESESHGWGAAAQQFVIEDVLGVKVTEPGAASVRIQPALGPLKQLDGIAWTQRGPVRVTYRHVETEDGGDAWKLHVETPANVVVELAVPAGFLLDGTEGPCTVPAANGALDAVLRQG